AWSEEDWMRKSTLLDRSLYLEMVSRPAPGAGSSIIRIVFHPMWLASMRRALIAFEEPIALAQRPWAERWAAVDQRQGEVTRRFLRRGGSGGLPGFTRTFSPPPTLPSPCLTHS